MALGAAEEPDLAFVDVGLDPARHGVRPRPPRDDDVGQSEALGEQEVAGCVGRGHGEVRESLAAIVGNTVSWRVRTLMRLW